MPGDTKAKLASTGVNPKHRNVGTIRCYQAKEIKK